MPGSRLKIGRNRLRWVFITLIIIIIIISGSTVLGRLTHWGFVTLLRHAVRLLTTPLDDWSARRKGLYLHRTTQHINTSDKHPCPQRDSNPWSQQPRGRWITPQTARPLGSTYNSQVLLKMKFIYCIYERSIGLNVRFLNFQTRFKTVGSRTWRHVGRLQSPARHERERIGCVCNWPLWAAAIRTSSTEH
jgi:hypothetical protein